ncbi:hypothetical protein C6988_04115 [Nitrosopumilus sp. b1]|uniref:hypothetical protein n=1 Tax=Nitrosopumilus sp. b1 TaxID=2109907 RepID=UPI0015F771F2|nr:hypothetical protein [Nitrosopumilus sp. b1]KAF6243266.1 hypothetical protein C6988_04115 [Nitrosopumilus sp. b1]
MDARLAIFVIVAVAAMFALAPMHAYAESGSVTPDGGDGYGDGEGKSCPSKEKKSASFTQLFI